MPTLGFDYAESSGVEVLVNPQFVERMEYELHSNNRKGDWREYKPEADEIRGEIAHHYMKMYWSMKDNDPAKVSEYAADVAVLAMKCAECFGMGRDEFLAEAERKFLEKEKEKRNGAPITTQPARAEAHY